MKFRLLAAIASAATVMPAYTQTIQCQVSGGVASATTIAWNAESRVARASFRMEGEAEGTVTAVRPHNASTKINLLLRPLKPLGSDEIEVLLVPSEEGRYRVFSVGYRTVAGVRHLNLLLGNDEASCSKQ